MILVPIEVAPRPSKTSTSSSTHGPIYTNTLHLPKEPPAASTGASQQNKPTISNPYIHISECFSGKPVPPQPPPRGSSNGGNGSQFKPAPPKTSKTSTGSHRHDSSTDEEQVIRNQSGPPLKRVPQVPMHLSILSKMPGIPSRNQNGAPKYFAEQGCCKVLKKGSACA